MSGSGAALTAAPASARSAAAKGLIMRTAERLYASRGLAEVSIRQIGEAAGQRNKSAVQYHFTGRDELIKAILAEHAEATERHRFAMMSPLGDVAGLSLRDQTRCIVLPRIEHHVELGTPSWYGRFLAQVVVEPALREYALQAHLDTPSLRRLYDAIHSRRDRHGPGQAYDPERGARREAMIRQLVVHMTAELEAELAREQPAADIAAEAWRRLGADLVTAVCGLIAAMDADENT
ncbi:TetR/AcrR family transcriptional regulator [Nonomuraea zeae]|uniref:TetR/AcrR family transcriptional regulator n=1 Tax=Nonomuraea zeae TaxID=1642303 RepID=UPI0036D3A5A4